MNCGEIRASDVTKHFPDDPAAWSNTTTAYSKSKVDTEVMINEAAKASGGRCDVTLELMSFILKTIDFILNLRAIY